MRRIVLALVTSLSLFAAFGSMTVWAKGHNHHSHHHYRPQVFQGHLTGKTVYFSIAGMEPDFDLVNRVIISTLIHSKGLPPIRLILDAYLERFQSDTQPVLPDLIHPKDKLQITLGGFFSGEAIIVGKGNQILYSGSMLAEALIDPRCLVLQSNVKRVPVYCKAEMQHMVVYLSGQGPAKGSYLNTRSWFLGNQKLQVTAGHIYGKALYTDGALKALRKGAGSLTVKQILKDVKVSFPHQRGTGGGSSGHLQCYEGHCINASHGAPSSTQGNHGTPPAATTTSGGGIRWTMVLGFALIGLAILLLAVYFWQGRREKRRMSSSEAGSS